MCLGIPGCIVKIDDAANMLATVDICGVRRLINISCIVDDDHPVEGCLGDWVLVHVGFAMSRIDDAGGRGDTQDFDGARRGAGRARKHPLIERRESHPRKERIGREQ